MQLRAIATVPQETPTTDPVRRARAGDLQAFEELYRRHAARIYGLCLRMTADPTRAEEGTQEAFIRVWQKLDTLQGEEGFGAWLRRVAINVVLGDGRTRRRHREKERALLQTTTPGGATAKSGPGLTLDLERAIGDLPAGAREVFVLYDVEGYRHAEIAEMLGVAPGTSKAQLHRARKLLREALER